MVNSHAKTMKAMCLTGHGGMDKLVLRTGLPLPEYGPGDVLIKVAATALNNTDINTRIGWYSKQSGASADASWSGEPIRFPRIQGIDVCGHIVAVGEGVSRQRIGERVLIEPCLQEYRGRRLPTPWFLGSECDGGFAQFCAAPARHAYGVNSQLKDGELASFPCSYSTAENMLTRARVCSGEKILVTGASGGVGSAAVQLARARGAEVIAVTNPDKAASLITLGATQTIDREESPLEALGNNAVDVVVDLVAGPRWPELLDVLRPFGRYAVAGAIGGALTELDVRTLYLKDLSFFGCTVLDNGVFQSLVDHIESGAIKPLVAAEFSLEDIVAAQEMFLAKTYTGKIVINVDG